MRTVVLNFPDVRAWVFRKNFSLTGWRFSACCQWASGYWWTLWNPVEHWRKVGGRLRRLPT